MVFKALITGATGLIGSHLLPVLEKDYEIYALTKEGSEEPQSSIVGSVQWVEADLTKQLPRDQLPDDLDIIVHLAQSNHFRHFPEKAEDVFGVNVAGCFNLLEYARQVGVKTFIMASSGIVYGNGDERFSEDEQLIVRNQSLGFYYTSKLCAESIAENYQRFMDVMVLRFFFVYGPGQEKSMLVPRLVRSVSEEDPISLDGHDGIQINPIYVEDAVKAIRKAIDLEGSHKINIGGADVLSLREIGGTIAEALGKEPTFCVTVDAVPKNLIGDIEKMKKLLGAPQTSFSEGIEKLLNHVCE